jgi:putative redox protein
MSSSQFEISLSLINQKVQFKGVSRNNPDYPITFDYLPPLGDGQGFKGIEMLLLSFAGCVSTAIVGLLRKMGKSISGYTMNVNGIRREQPLSLQKICFEVILKSNDIENPDIEGVIKKAEEISPVWIALKSNVEVEAEYKIITA